MAALEALRVSKRFGGVVALEAADFTLDAGEVHVLIGANGCGKSTLCKIIAGALAADSGTVRVGGEARRFANPAEARAAGIATVYQETSLIPTLSVAHNILLGAEPRGAAGFVDRRALRRQAAALMERVGALARGIAPDTRVEALSVDQQQIVEFIKVLGQAPRILLLDEATSSLDRAQVAALFDIVRGLREQGCAIIFISHRMEELFAIGDRVTVVRNGRTVATLAIRDTTREEVVRLMVGGGGAEAVPARRRAAPGAEVLRADALAGARFRDVSFTLRAGECLGLGGLHGQGQSSLLLALFGAEPARAGGIAVAGARARLRSPAAAMRRGLAYVSGDRGRAGAFAIRPIIENLSAALLVRRRWALALPARLRAVAAPLVARLRLVFPGYAAPLSALSGGNQQKVIVARWLATAPRILLLDDPTKGIDIQAKRDLYDLIGELCAEGAAVILYSSEDGELLGLADRVLVFNSGQVVAELAGARMTEFDLNAASLAMA